MLGENVLCSLLSKNYIASVLIRGYCRSVLTRVGLMGLRYRTVEGLSWKFILATFLAHEADPHVLGLTLRLYDAGVGTWVWHIEVERVFF